MDIKTKYQLYHKIAFSMAIIMLAEVIYPTAALALTSGPGSPEFSSFEPVATTNMVNEFSGGFTYNLPVLEIPGASGGGYACALSYHSGETVESEASWVGYGWSLNPGAINRNKRGFADDVNGNTVTYKNDVPANWTISAGAQAGNIETFSVSIPVSVSASLRYNNYKGFGYTAGAGLSIQKGLVSLGYSVSDGSGSFSVSVNPGAILSQQNDKKKKADTYAAIKSAKGEKKDALVNEQRKKNKTSVNDKMKSGGIGAIGSIGSAYGMHAFSDDLRATNLTPYIGTSFNMSVSAVIEPGPVPVGLELGFNANLTRQENIPSRDLKTYGYMYSNQALADDGSMMDYYVEKEATYNKRDRYLSIPFSNADIYSVTGEGVGGGFRMYNQRAGTFYPNEVSSYTPIVQMGTSVHVGLDLGMGFNLGVGFQELQVKRDWDEPGNISNYQFGDANNEGSFFRFNNDKGGTLTYTSGTAAASAGLDLVRDVPGLKTAHANVPSGDIYTAIADTTENGLLRSGRSSYIAYHTNGQMSSETSPSGKKYKSYQKNSDIESLLTRSNIGDGIGELAVNNEDGNRYIYGLPVYSTNETSMQYDLRGSTVDVRNNFIAYKTSTDHRIQVGEINKNPYATSYLLTAITSPDYVDRSLDGLTDDDFGGYTKFSYSRAYGSNDKVTTSNMYHWRIPYTGLSYNPNDLTDNLDDAGSFTSGDKEIYYLQKIETKTHVAVFVTNKTNISLGGHSIAGTGAVRQDGLQADSDDQAILDDSKKGSAASQQLQMLERIELYAKPVDGTDDYRLLKTTHFEYDYSTCPNVPNNIGNSIDKNGATPAVLTNINLKKGKLTLRKVWFEYEGVVNARISPYKFDYTYPTGLGINGLPAVYSSIKDYGASLADSIQNPSYSPFNLDRWGNPQPRGEERHDSLMTHLDQTVNGSSFDPAAWQLKKITLPSGGEILVQYEQNDYLYVQDRRAMAMVSLKTDVHTTQYQDENNIYYLNVESDLGITTHEEKEALVQLIGEQFREHKMYFKYFYALIGNSADLHSCYSDYVKGYVDMFRVGLDGSDNVYVQLGNGGIYSPDSYQLPRNACKDYVKKEKSGKLRPIGNCNASDDGIPDGASPLGIAQQLISKIGTTFLPDQTCLTLNEKLSYLRIPVLHGKKGGGVRVKRILMHDPGIETGDEMLYGSEYIYKTVDGQSSGVATNEPSEGKEESALVRYLPKRNDQGIINRLIAGKDKEQFEGPIGEYLLPAPSVGYSRVVVKNIHTGKTNTGFTVNEFYTAKDYAFDKNYDNNPAINGPAVDYTGIAQKKDWLMIPAVFANISINNLWLTQGYRFVTNEMNGQPKNIATYSGDYDGEGNPDNLTLSSSQHFSYYEPGEKIPVMTDVGTLVMGNPGKETEVVMENKSVEDRCMDTNFEMDVTIGLLLPVFPAYFSFMGSGSYTESKLRTHVTSKIVHYPAIQKSVTTYQDGIHHLTENVAFSPFTGKPLLTKTTDGYNNLNLQQSTNHNGSYMAFSVPAAKEYSEMGQMASNENAKVTITSPAVTCNVSQVSGLTYNMVFSASPGNTVCNAMKALCRGDLIRVINTSSGTGFYHVDDITGSTVTLLASKLLNGASSPAVGDLASYEIIRSGKTNQLNTMASSFTTYGTGQDVSVDTLNQSYLNTRASLVASLNSLSLPGVVNFSGSAKSIINPATGDCFPKEIGCDVGLSVSGGQLQIRIYDSVGFYGRDVCTSFIGASGGTFALDRKTGNIVYYTSDNPCHALPVPCLTFCTGTGQSINPVVAASASTFNHHWPFDTVPYKLLSSQTFAPYNPYETGEKGKWRMESSYAYNSGVTGGSKQGTTERNYKNAGTFTMTLFNWKDAVMNDSAKWVRTNTVTRYSPNGEAIEETDAIGVKSTAKYGYKGMLPYITAQNASYRSVQFESFENLYSSTKLEEGVTITLSQTDIAYAHSGRASLQLKNAFASVAGVPKVSNLVMKPVPLTNQIISKGLELKAWVKDPYYSSMPITAVLSDSANSSITQNVTFKKVAQTGEWTLYAAHITSFVSGMVNAITTISTTYPVSDRLSVIWIDDVRIQPYDAQVMSYVYDNRNLRLLASFDDQHFGMFYQYNAEGKLVRKKIETLKGIKTIQETQYHTPLEARQ